MLQEIGRTSEHIASASQQMASTSEEAGRAVGEIAQAVTWSPRAPRTRSARSARPGT